MTLAAEILTGNDVIADAERLRRRAKSIVQEHPGRYANVVGEPSGWSVVTKRGWWACDFHNMLDEDRLCEMIERGHKVILIVGMVAARGTALTATNHVAVVSKILQGEISGEKLARMVFRAKRCAASALYG